MKNLETFYPFNPKSEFYSEETNRWIQEDFIEPLNKLGFTFLGTASTKTEDDNGSHIFHFRQDGRVPITPDDLHFLRGYDEGSNWDYFRHYDSLTFVINWSA